MFVSNGGYVAMTRGHRYVKAAGCGCCCLVLALLGLVTVVFLILQRSCEYLERRQTEHGLSSQRPIDAIWGADKSPVEPSDDPPGQERQA